MMSSPVGEIPLFETILPDQPPSLTSDINKTLLTCDHKLIVELIVAGLWLQILETQTKADNQQNESRMEWNKKSLHSL